MVKSRKVKNIFQSTPSVWRATHCGAKMDGKEVISIHALRGEGDLAGSDRVLAIAIFQSTPSVGRATFCAARTPSLKLFQSTPSVGRATYVPL